MDKSKPKKSALLWVIIVVIIIVVVAAMVYFVTTGGKKTNTNAANNSQISTNSNINQSTINTNSLAANPFVGDGFTVDQLSGWIVGHMVGTLVSFHNTTETQPKGSPAAKINFKSYLAVSFDNTQGKTLEKINQLAVDNLKSTIPSTNIFAISNETVNGLAAKFTALELNQQDVSYSVLIAIYLAGDKYYSLSFNTTTEKWKEYQDSFYRVARSFKVS